MAGTTINSYTFDVVAAPTPLVPSGVTATASAGLQVAINAANTASQPSGTTYNLLRGTSSGGENTTPVATGFTLPYNYVETAAGTYFYQLTATSGGATSAPSSEVSAVAYNQQSGGSNVATGTAQAPSAGAVTSLSAVLADSGTAPRPTLSWVLPASGGAPTGFNVRRGTTSGSESATPLNGSPLAANAITFVDTTAAYATDYYYVVDSLSAGVTVTSAELHVKTDTAAPSLTVIAGNNQNTLSITNAGGTLGVLIKRGPHGGTLTALTTLGTAAASYTDSTAVNGTAYDYQVFDLD